MAEASVWQEGLAGLRAYPGAMGHTALMLSALATSAVPGFQAVSTQTLSSAEKDVALVHDVNQVPWLVGTTEVGQHTLSVCEYLPGQAPSAHKVTPILAASIGTALAQIHSLPTSSVQDFDRPAESAIDSLRECAGIVDRAAATGLIPQALLRRWETACEDSSLWQFEPTVIHGLMQLGHLLVENENVVAVDQWRDFRVGDPARDLAWLTTPAASEFHMAVVTSYRSARTSADRWVMQRARFYAELDVAKWLLHGMDSHNETITEDATAMLSALHDRVSGDMDQALTQPISQAKHPLEN
ncbi:MAG: phosphotransferase [Pontimonas sp.]|nr:phosphotransferase [Pontimonas sp.]